MHQGVVSARSLVGAVVKEGEGDMLFAMYDPLGANCYRSRVRRRTPSHETKRYAKLALDILNATKKKQCRD